MATLFSATLDLAKILGSVMESMTTAAGSATTVIDTAMPRNSPPNDAYKFGTIWILSGTAIGKTGIVTGWATATGGGTFTVTTLGDAPGTPVRYAFLDRDYPRDVLRQAVNTALQTIGRVLDVYTNATFVTVANQEDYTLPTDVYNVRQVELATSASAPYYYQKHYHWSEIDGVIRFKSGYAPTHAGDLIRLTYAIQPDELDDDATEISDYIHPDLLKWTAAVNALMWKQPAMGEQVAHITQKLQMATQMERIMATRHRISTINKITLSRWA